MDIKILVGALLLQLLALCLFSYEFIVSIFGFSQLDINWEVHEAIELISVAGLVIGSLMTLFYLRNTLRRNAKVEEQLSLASKSFHKVLLGKFEDWGLSDAESENALLIVKGFSIAEISKLREKSEGTIKAQNSAIYAKSGLAGRAQFASYFLEELTASF